MEWVNENLVESLLIIGMMLLGIEVLVLGFSTFVIFFVGLAALITAGLVYISVIPPTILSAILSIGVLSAFGAVLLWKPLKQMQFSVQKDQVQNDFIGLRFVLTGQVSKSDSPSYRYSGIDWKLVSEDRLPKGMEVEVVKTEVGVFHVAPASQEGEED